MNTLRCAALMAGLMALLGCALLSMRHDTLAVYALSATAVPMAAPSTGLHAWQIQVAAPQASPALQGTRILVQPLPGQSQVYAGARWQDAPPEALQAVMLRSLRERGGVMGVAGGGSLMRADFRLESEVLAFLSEYRGAPVPTVVIAFDARLLRLADGAVVAARRFTAEERASATDVPAVIAAFNRAVDALMGSLTTWLLAAGDSGTPWR